MRPVALALSALALAVSAGAAAADYVKITSETEFAALIRAHRLERIGISLTVTPDGGISGRAFGKPVIGSWVWKGGYFCRDLAWGERTFAHNCQEVARNGDALRFTSDKGTGESAQLYLR